MRPDCHSETAPSRGEQAGEWCVRLSTGSLTPLEQSAFDDWMGTDPANVEAFDQALAVWNSLHSIRDAPEMISQRADALESLRRANHQRWSRRIRLPHWVIGTAAAVVLMLVSGGALYTDIHNRPDIYATGMGERRTLVLSDGSRLSLDAETTVSVTYKSGQRALTLMSGRAKFDVAKDLHRPFTVTAGDRTVIATGTAFSVELLGQQVHIILYEGHVAVLKGTPPSPKELLAIKAHPGTTATILSPGMELVSDLDSRAVPRMVQSDVVRSLAWEGGQLNFADEPMSAAIEQLNRYSRTKVVIGDDRVAAIRVNGVFNVGDATAFAEAVSEAYPVRIEHDGSDLVLASTASH